MRIAIITALALTIGIGVAAQHHYAFYYYLSNEQDLEINLLNTMIWPTDVVLTVHDAFGGEIWTVVDEIGGNEASFVRLSESIDANDYSWGVVTVDSVERLVIGLEYFRSGQLVSVDTVYSPVPELESGEPFWLGTYHSQVGDASTAFIVMNPGPYTATCTVSAYDYQGNTLYSGDFVLGPFEAEGVDLEREVGSSSSNWGFLDVAMEDHPVILALEYTGRDCSGLEIDNVTEFYF